MLYEVEEVIDGDTFIVSPNWYWDGKEGNRVRISGLNTPEAGQIGFQKAKTRLKYLIEGKSVELRNYQTVSYGRLVCDVYSNGKSIVQYLPEYAKR